MKKILLGAAYLAYILAIPLVVVGYLSPIYHSGINWTDENGVVTKATRNDFPIPGHTSYYKKVSRMGIVFESLQTRRLSRLTTYDFIDGTLDRIYQTPTFGKTVVIKGDALREHEVETIQMLDEARLHFKDMVGKSAPKE